MDLSCMIVCVGPLEPMVLVAVGLWSTALIALTVLASYFRSKLNKRALGLLIRGSIWLMLIVAFALSPGLATMTARALLMRGPDPNYTICFHYASLTLLLPIPIAATMGTLLVRRVRGAYIEQTVT